MLGTPAGTSPALDGSAPRPHDVQLGQGPRTAAAMHQHKYNGQARGGGQPQGIRGRGAKALVSTRPLPPSSPYPHLPPPPQDMHNRGLPHLHKPMGRHQPWLRKLAEEEPHWHQAAITHPTWLFTGVTPVLANPGATALATLPSPLPLQDQTPVPNSTAMTI